MGVKVVGSVTGCCGTSTKEKAARFLPRPGSNCLGSCKKRATLIGRYTRQARESTPGCAGAVDSVLLASTFKIGQRPWGKTVL